MREIFGNEIKMIALAALIEFDRICTENNIKYSLIGGTLLGAIRHNGFIPWDDDIDICMMRSEYEKLLDVGKEYNALNTRYKFEMPEYENGYKCPFGKFVDYNTKIIDVECDYGDMGVYVDIFPLDYIDGDTFDDAEAYFNKLINFQRLAAHASINKYHKLSFKLKAIRKFLFNKFVKLSMLFLHDKYYYFKKLKEKLLSFSGRKYVVSGMLKLPYLTLWEYKKLEVLTKHLFENFEFPIFENYDYVLRIEYNNYMELPPADKRTLHYGHVYIR